MPDMNANGNELRMAVDADTIGLKSLYFNALVALGTDGDLGAGIDYIDRHNNKPVRNRHSFLKTVVGRCL